MDVKLEYDFAVAEPHDPHIESALAVVSKQVVLPLPRLRLPIPTWGLVRLYWSVQGPDELVSFAG
jgi:hypothetical protein